MAAGWCELGPTPCGPAALASHPLIPGELRRGDAPLPRDDAGRHHQSPDMSHGPLVAYMRTASTHGGAQPDPAAVTCWMADSSIPEVIGLARWTAKPASWLCRTSSSVA
jgi:hypothetical protein